MGVSGVPDIRELGTTGHPGYLRDIRDIRNQDRHGPCGGLPANAGLLLCGVGNETDFQKKMESGSGMGCAQGASGSLPDLLDSDSTQGTRGAEERCKSTPG